MRAPLLVAAIALAALGACSEDEPSTLVARAAADGPIDTGSAPRTYRITYDVELPAAGSFEEEVVEGRPPFDVRIERTDEDGELEALDVVTFGVVDVGPPDQDRAALVVGPSVPSKAPVFSGDLAAAIDADLAVDLEQGATIAGRNCRFVRVGGSLESGAFEQPTEDDHTDLCIDGRSLILHEEWVANGEVARRRTATEVEIDAELDEDAFAPLGERLTEGFGGGRVRRMTDDSRFPDVESFELADPPGNLRHLGRYVVALDAELDAQGLPGTRTVGLADVYVDGADLVVVENLGSTTVRAPALPADDGIAWDVDGFEDVRLLLTAGQSELRRVDPDSGRAIRMVGTLDVDELTELFSSLVSRTGPAETEPYDDVVDVIDQSRS